MKNKQFHISDILTITTGLLLSSRGMNGVYEILNHLTGESIFTHQIPRAMKECNTQLLKQFPQFNNTDYDSEVELLQDCLQSESGKKEREHLINGWMVKQVEKHGEMFDVIPTTDYKPQNPVDELIEMRVGK